MAKLFFYACETTGVKYWQNAIHQISGCIEIDGVVMEYFDYKVRPFEDAVIDEEALKIGRVTRAEIEQYPHRDVVFKQLIVMLAKYVDRFDKGDKFFLVGFNNANFDNNFFRQFFILCGDDKYFGAWFWANSIDVMVLAAQYFMRVRKHMTNFKQATVARQCGVIVDDTKLHDAEYDVELLRAIYKEVTTIDYLLM
jgi:DNA polymerase-3 subunit epsilon